MTEAVESYEGNPAFDCVVEDSVRLLESMSTLYGAERAMEMWAALGREVGAEVQARVFLVMLTGHGGTRVYARRGTCTQAVTAIKTIRAYTGLGLKEAKDMWDLTAVANKEIVIECNKREHARNLSRELRDIGMLA